RVPVKPHPILTCRVSGTSENGEYILRSAEVPLTRHDLVCEGAGTRTSEKAHAFPLIRAYAEIPLRGMIAPNRFIYTTFLQFYITHHSCRNKIQSKSLTL
ncbi:MAG: hypothetical protein K2M41_00680, partial [Muribaculaceae bacterium]|nr:hypothetical protein [Muribaculaceae bacterium]